MRRLVTDYAYWAAVCYRIRNKHGKIVPFRLKPNQVAVGVSEARQIAQRGRARTFILKARQGGFTTDQQARSLWQIWRQPGYDCLTVTDTGGNTEKIFEITRRAVEHFPEDLLPEMSDKVTNQIHLLNHDAKFFTGTAGSKKLGRGLTLKRVHFSEAAFYPSLSQALESVGPGLVPFGSVITLETTASGQGSEAHLFWEEAEGRGFVRQFFPWWECDPENYRSPLTAPDELTPADLTDEERALVARYGLDLAQIKWRREQINQYTRVGFLTEYAESPDQCWRAVGGMFYDAELLGTLQHRTTRPVSGQETPLWRFAELADDDRAIIGADTAEGVGGDASTWVARSLTRGRLLSTFLDPSAEPDEFADAIAAEGYRHADRDGPALLVVEKNLHGITVLRRLRDHHRYPVERLYHRVSLTKDTVRATGKVPTREIGWHTSAESKPLLLDAGRQVLHAVRDGFYDTPDARTLAHYFGVRRDGSTGKVVLNGRDLVVAENLAWIGRTYPIASGATSLPRSVVVRSVR